MTGPTAGRLVESIHSGRLLCGAPARLRVPASSDVPGHSSTNRGGAATRPTPKED